MEGVGSGQILMNPTRWGEMERNSPGIWKFWKSHEEKQIPRDFSPINANAAPISKLKSKIFSSWTLSTLVLSILEDTFSDPVCHFVNSWRQIWILQMVRHWMQNVVAGYEQLILVQLLGWYNPFFTLPYGKVSNTKYQTFIIPLLFFTPSNSNPNHGDLSNFHSYWEKITR